MRCRLCNGLLDFLGNLGVKDWFRCRHCGMEWSISDHPKGTFEEKKCDLSCAFGTCECKVYTQR